MSATVELLWKVSCTRSLLQLAWKCSVLNGGLEDLSMAMVQTSRVECWAYHQNQGEDLSIYGVAISI